MVWSRKWLWEWAREPLSPIIESLIPSIEKEVNRFFKKRLGVVFKKPTWKTLNGYFYFRFNPLDFLLQPGGFSLPFRTIKDLSSLNKEWQHDFLPHYKKKIKKFRKIKLGQLTNNELLKHLQKLIRLEARVFTFSAYLGLSCICHEILFSWVYLLTKDKNRRHYIRLIRGYYNKTIEADQKLWELAQTSGPIKKISDLNKNEKVKKLFKEFLKTYGHRVFDIDVIHPVLAENQELLLNLIQLYSRPDTPSPRSRQKKIATKRTKHEKWALKNLRGWFPFSRWIFKKTLKAAQKHAEVRESRPFYHLMGFSLSRQTLLELGRRFSQFENSSDIFYLTFKEIKMLAKNPSQSGKEIKRKVKKRKALRERQKKIEPPDILKQ